jgi:hopanoid-associated phosphorylase
MRREARIVGAQARVCQRGIGLDEALAQGGEAVISFGLCGALDPSLKVGDLVIGEAVTDGDRRYDCDAPWTAALGDTLPHARQGLFWADGKMITGVKEKTRLLQATGAVAVDMESHIAAKAAAAHGVPFAIVRAVSDSAVTEIPPVAKAAFAPDGRIDVAAVARRVVFGRLGELWDLIPLARDAGLAFRALQTVMPATSRVRL